MMIECAPLKRESTLASLESTAALSRSTSSMIVVESTTSSPCACCRLVRTHRGVSS